MNALLNNSTATPQRTSIRLQPTQEYSTWLNALGIAYDIEGYFYRIGRPSRPQGWQLHLSIIRSQFQELCNIILPYLRDETISFKIVQTKETLRSLLDGSLGLEEIGKVITIYPESDEAACLMAQNLIQSTAMLSGPAVLTDLHIGGILYTRYGAFLADTQTDVHGHSRPHILNHEGKLVPDVCDIPYRHPKGRTFPFSDFTSEVPPISEEIGYPYRIIRTIKPDPKGTVWEALYVRFGIFVRRCIIKEGREKMWSDDFGRDMADRLRWQAKFAIALSGKASLPKFIDLFFLNGHAYLVMEFINGNPVHSQIKSINRNSIVWFQLDISIRKKLLGYCIGVAKTLENLHHEGYVHRDVTPDNFMVKRNGKVIAIDNELSYSNQQQDPNPPFEAGTHGFMSPQQLEHETPTYADDVFGLGATLVTLLTGISPISIPETYSSSFWNDLHFFLRDEALSNVLKAALSPNRQNRPSTTHVIQILTECRNQCQPIQTPDLVSNNLTEIIQSGIIGLAAPHTLLGAPLWLSQERNSKGEVKSSSSYVKSIGLYEGFAGVVYFLCKANQAGFDTSSCDNALNTSINYLITETLDDLETLSPGLFGGGAGVALTLLQVARNHRLDYSDRAAQMIDQCLSIPTEDLSISTGLAGQILARLAINAYYPSKYHEEKLAENIDRLMSRRGRDFTWVRMRTTAGQDEPAYSIVHGDTGIILTVLKYLITYPDNKLRESLAPSLLLLEQNAEKYIKNIQKYGFRMVFDDKFEGESFIGLVLCLLYAYKLQQEPRLKLQAEHLLSVIPKYPSHENIFQASGIAGMGELYLEANNILAGSGWWFRAEYIASYLEKVACKCSDGTVYWLGPTAQFPTADLMNGNSGVLHFLTRFKDPKSMSYCLF